MRVLDLYCAAGGAGMGYHLAGDEVVGVDNKPQPRYPFTFHRADALEYLAEHGRDFDFIHASPPCQHYSKAVKKVNRKDHPDLVAATREALMNNGAPWVMENVPGAPLLSPFILCGSFFDLPLRRHRLFEASFFILVPTCSHTEYPAIFEPAYNRKNKMRVVSISGGFQNSISLETAGKAMGIDWMTMKELSLAIPPAYTRYISERYKETR